MRGRSECIGKETSRRRGYIGRGKWSEVKNMWEEGNE